MTKITAEHLARCAIVYVRQSTAYQVTNNLESQRRQYGLVERGRQLGWSDVQVIDDDLGRSGGGTARPGFEKLLAAICEGRVGAVLSIEASRLARNGRDWHTLLEFCGLVDTLIIDEDGIYDPRSPNDRLLLGMKGTMSEMELSVFRQRSREAMQQKARRGELFLTVAVGYVKTDDDRIEKDPDRRVRDAIALVFTKFAELQTVRQVLVWFRQEKVLLPAFVQGTGRRPIEWKAPVYHTLHHMLTNPVYAGAYVFGRRGMRVTIEGGRKRVVRSLNRDPKDWDVLIQGSSRRLYLMETVRKESASDRGQRKREELHGTWLDPTWRGAARRPVSAVADAARSSRSPTAARAARRSAMSAAAPSRPWRADSCIAFGGMRVDRAVAAEVLERLQPLGIEAALAALAAQDAEKAEQRRQLENALEAGALRGLACSPSVRCRRSRESACCQRAGATLE